MPEEPVTLKGHVVIKEIDANGNVVSVEEGDNVICINGSYALCATLGGTGMTVFNYMIISTDQTAVNRTHTSISPVTAASTVLTPSISTNTCIWTYTFASGGSATIWKFGMATTNGATSIWNEYLFGAAKDNSTNSLQITYTATFP